MPVNVLPRAAETSLGLFITRDGPGTPPEGALGLLSAAQVLGSASPLAPARLRGVVQ